MKNAIKYLAIFAVTAAAGFAAMALPFRLFEELSQTEMRMLLAIELAALAGIMTAAGLARDARERKRLRKKAERRALREGQRTEPAQPEGLDIAA